MPRRNENWSYVNECVLIHVLIPLDVEYYPCFSLKITNSVQQKSFFQGNLNWIRYKKCLFHLITQCLRFIMEYLLLYRYINMLKTEENIIAGIVFYYLNILLEHSNRLTSKISLSLPPRLFHLQILLHVKVW